MSGLAQGIVRFRWTILAVTVLAQMASGGITQGVPTLAAFYQVDLHLTKAQVGLFSSSIAVGQMFVMLASGWVADLVGIRRVMLVGLLSNGVALVAVSRAGSFTQAAALLMLAGLASGIASPSIPKAILVWFPPRNRGFAMGIQRTGIPLMGAVAAATLPSIALVYGWRTALDVLGAAVATAGLLVFAVYREGPATPSTGTSPSRRPGSPLRLLRNRNILLVSVLPSILVAVQFSLVSYLVLYLTESLGAPIVVAGGALAIAQMGGVVARVFWGIVSDRVFQGGRRAVMLLVGVMSFFLLATMGALPSGVPLWMVTLLAAVLGALTLGWHGVYTILLPELSGKELAGSAVGLGYTLLQIGTLFGPPLFGYTVDLTGDYRWAWRVLAAGVAVGTALMLLVKEGRKG